MFKEIKCEQGSNEWFEARLGKITASVFDKVLTKTGKLSSSHKDLINMAVAELIIGEKQETFQSDAMKRGNELEDEALRFFNFTHDYKFEKCGFLLSDMGGFGCSPDGIDWENKIGLELKCPLAHNHIAYLSENKLPQKYMQQVQGSLMVTGFDKWIFGSYHPQIQGLHVVVERDEEYIAKLRDSVLKCTEMVKEAYERLKVLKAA